MSSATLMKILVSNVKIILVLGFKQTRKQVAFKYFIAN